MAAKARTSAIRIVKPQVVRVPAAPKKKGHRRHHSASGSGSEKHRAGAIGASLVLGLLDKQGTTFPTVPMLGRAGSLALACYFLRKKNPMLNHAATGFASIAAYQFGRSGSISGESVVGESTEGHATV